MPGFAGRGQDRLRKLDPALAADERPGLFGKQGPGKDHVRLGGRLAPESVQDDDEFLPVADERPGRSGRKEAPRPRRHGAGGGAESGQDLDRPAGVGFPARGDI